MTRNQDRKRPPWGWVPEWQAELFVDELAIHGDVKRACENLGIIRQYTYWERKNNPEFAAMVEESLAICDEDAEANLRRLATVGRRNRTIDPDGRVTTVEEDVQVKAIEVLLRARMPRLYGKKVEQTVVDGGTAKKLYGKVDADDM